MKTFFLLLITASVLAVWNDPVEIDRNAKYHGPKGMYTDPKTGITHFLWASKGTTAESKIMYYSQIDTTNKIIYKYEFKHDEATAFVSGVVSGSGNGKDYQIVITGLRIAGMSEYFDQWYTESSDCGKTWEPLTRVPREDMVDRCNRRKSSLIVVTETKRIYLYYTVDCITGKKYIAHVTKPASSHVFSPEKEIYKSPDKELVPSVVAEYTLLRGRPVIHLFWGEQDPGRPVLYMNSTDNGVTFSKPREINSRSYYQYCPMFALATNRKISNELVGTYMVEFPNSLLMFYSKDNGEKFSDTVVNSQSVCSLQDRLIGLAICGSKENPQIFSIVQTGQNYVEYTVWNATSMKGKVEAHPFSTVNSYELLLTCYVNEDKKIIVNVMMTNGSRDTHFLYMAQDIRNLDD